MKLPDVDRLYSEKERSLTDFLQLYNANLPLTFKRASAPLLVEFKDTHADAFKGGEVWSLDLHRKKVMDWLSSRPV
ncbi:MAG: hypothetical protein AAB472_02690 [Patescibacteria group bacterium]